MPRFNPFARVNARHGAPMGRHGVPPEMFMDAPGKLYARHCGGDGYYDRGGAYWGHSKVCAVWSRGGGMVAYIEAYTPAVALEIVRKAVEEARA